MKKKVLLATFMVNLMILTILNTLSTNTIENTLEKEPEAVDVNHKMTLQNILLLGFSNKN